VHVTLEVFITDTGDRNWLEIRNGVGIVYDQPPDHVDFTMEMTRDLLNKTKFQPDKITDAIQSDALLIKGSKEDALRFFSYFENLGEHPINLSLH